MVMSRSADAPPLPPVGRAVDVNKMDVENIKIRKIPNRQLYAARYEHELLGIGLTKEKTLAFAIEALQRRSDRRFEAEEEYYSRVGQYAKNNDEQ